MENSVIIFSVTISVPEASLSNKYAIYVYLSIKYQ